MKVVIDSRDLSYTIDTYGTFTLDSEYEYEVDALMQDDDTLDFTNFDDRYDVEYDMQGYREHLAHISADLLHENIVEASDYVEKDDGTRELVKHGIVASITVEDTKSPKFYNFTTDSYTAEWIFNEDKLNKFCLDHADEFEKFRDEHWSYEWDNPRDDDTLAVIQLDFYTRETYSEDDYVDEMYERQNGYEYITFTPRNKEVTT